MQAIWRRSFRLWRWVRFCMWAKTRRLGLGKYRLESDRGCKVGVALVATLFREFTTDLFTACPDEKGM